MRAALYVMLGTCLGAVAEDACPVPELGALLDWTGDLRSAAGAAGLDALASCPSSRRRALVVGVDGLRAAAAAMLPLPNLRRLEAVSRYSYYATTQWSGVTYSGPGWASVFTGAEPSRTGVSGNSDMGDAVASGYPTFVKLAADLGLQAAVAATWHPILDDLVEPDALAASRRGASDDDTTDAIVDWISGGAMDLIVAHLDDVDHAGHAYGFDGYDDEYGAAVRETDARLGRMLDAAVAEDTTEWLIVLTTDHGGNGAAHGGDTSHERRVPLLVGGNSPRLHVGRHVSAFDDPEELDQGSHMDVGPTVLYFFDEAAGDASPDGQVFGFAGVDRRAPESATHPPTAGCDGDTAECACAADGSDYAGTVAVTASGRVCQRWDSQEPHGHEFSDLPENYCRNPDSEDWAWCYTTDEDERWEFCDAAEDVPRCEELEACRDSTSWYYKKADRTCRLYVAENPSARCHKKDTSKIAASDACPAACGDCAGDCEDSTSWYAKKPSKDCAYIAKSPGDRCENKKDESKVKASDACPATCDAC